MNMTKISSTKHSKNTRVFFFLYLFKFKYTTVHINYSKKKKKKKLSMFEKLSYFQWWLACELPKVTAGIRINANDKLGAIQLPIIE